MNRTFVIALAMVAPALPLAAQSSAAACGPANDSTARQVVKSFDDLRVCMLAFSGDGAIGDGPRVWMATAARVVLETQRPGDFRRMSMTIASGRVDWTINGKPKNYDGPSVAWRSAVVDLLAKVDEADDLRKQVSPLRLQIDSLPQLRQRTAAEIAATERRARDLTTAIHSLQSSDRSLGAQLSQLESRSRALESQATRDRGSAARQTDPSARARADAAARQAEMEMARLQEQIRSVERRRRELDAERRVPLMEWELRDLRPEHTLTLLRLQLRDLEALSVPALERELAELDADNRLRVLHGEIAKALAHLHGQLDAPPESPGIR